MNIANDLVIDPKNAQHILAALGWRNGAAYNGFYESTDGGVHWAKINPTGGLDATDVGYANFAYSSDGKKLYVINQSPKKGASKGFINTELDGVYESDKGLGGPWNRIATPTSSVPPAPARRSRASRARAIARAIQSWYNQSIAVDPANANHVMVGLEEEHQTAMAARTGRRSTRTGTSTSSATRRMRCIRRTAGRTAVRSRPTPTSTR